MATALQVLLVKVRVRFLGLAHSCGKQPMGRHTTNVDNTLPHKRLQNSVTRRLEGADEGTFLIRISSRIHCYVLGFIQLAREGAALRLMPISRNDEDQR